MIISHKHKFIYFAIPKTGTHTVREVLRPILGDEDEEQCNLIVHKEFSNEKLKKLQHGHIAYVQLEDNIDNEVLETYFKFTFVRNPWERFISNCYFAYREDPEFAEFPMPFINNQLKELKSIEKNLLAYPQHEFICNQQKELKMDFIGRTESMQDGIDFIFNKLGEQAPKIGRKNSTKHLPYKEYYTPLTEQIIRTVYTQDVEAFNYEY